MNGAEGESVNVQRLKPQYVVLPGQPCANQNGVSVRVMQVVFRNIVQRLMQSKPLPPAGAKTVRACVRATTMSPSRRPTAGSPAPCGVCVWCGAGGAGKHKVGGLPGMAVGRMPRAAEHELSSTSHAQHNKGG